MLHTMIVIHEGQQTELHAQHVDNLRRLLLDAGLSPYTRVTRIANCGGRGLCATCGVWITDGEPAPNHWHDQLAGQFGYPRLSCQIAVENDMTIHILSDKWIWGRRDPDQKWTKNQS